jgi:hypothetical protein
MNYHLNKPYLLLIAEKNYLEKKRLGQTPIIEKVEINRNAQILDILEEENLNVDDWNYYLKKNGFSVFELIKIILVFFSQCY